jgi:large subunit ribosomal protein L23
MTVLVQPHVSEKAKVEGVNLLNRPGKTRRFKNMPGKRNGYKKAYVRLVSGQTIDFTGTPASSRSP